MIWSCLFYLGIYVVITLRRGTLKALMQQTRRQWLLAAIAAAALAMNWGIYIYAVNSGQIVQGSLAYFINPMLNVGVGVMFFKEKLSKFLKLALALALLGVLIQVAFAAAFPWIALSLALLFCAYGVVKKTLRTAPELSSAMEGLVGLLPALCMASYFRTSGGMELETREWLLLIGSGVVTGLPLILFSAAAQALPYSLLGMLQYIAPSLQFLVGILVFGETLGLSGILSFALIWIGVACYFVDLLRNQAVVPART